MCWGATHPNEGPPLRVAPMRRYAVEPHDGVEIAQNGSLNINLDGNDNNGRGPSMVWVIAWVGWVV